MQRVRIGLTGLACVFLLVLLAASLFGLVGRNAMAPQGQTVNANGSVVAKSEDAPKEPLAELGVAPGNAPEHQLVEKAPAASPQPARPTRPHESR